MTPSDDTTLPQAPQQISPDGREVWDWADRLSEYTQRLHRRRELAARIRAAETECGSCIKWMTRSCPRERHDNQRGRSVGPSSRDLKCQEFAMSASHEKHLAAAREEYAALGHPKEPNHG
jgi:hypothetical protein